MKIFNKTLLVGMGITAILTLSGCANNNNQTNASVETRYCNMPQSKQLSVAIEESRSTLSNRDCQSDYAEHFSALVDIAAGEPDAKNLETLGIQSQWMVKKGIITKKDSESMLRRYFSPQLVSLDYESDFNTYSHCSMNSKQNELTRLLDNELEQKRKGLALALGDNEAYQMALKEHQSVKLLLESTQKACTSDS
ncbi:MAG TPA: hypothetical protein ENJ60_08285 [Aeromonadales bacterium]|nr:hypothetical protein [Aeromonadales bacterium]